MKKIFTILVFSMLLLNISLVFAEENHQSEIEEGKKLTESRISCDKLSDEQLETIGEYLMEQMHSGEAHEAMDQMMGGEGSESLKQMHINMAKKFYCNEDVDGMMNSGSMMGNNMMSSGMMGNSPAYLGYNNFWNISWLVFLIGITILIIWFIYEFVRTGKESETPIKILQKRYVKGELNKNQFEKMKNELKEGNYGKR